MFTFNNSKNWILEKDINEKRYFSDKQPVTIKQKCYLCLALILAGLLTTNIVLANDNAQLLHWFL